MFNMLINGQQSLDYAPSNRASQVIQVCTLSASVVLCLLAALQNHFDLEHLFTLFTNVRPHSVQVPLPGSPNLMESTWFFSLKYYYTDFDRPAYPGQQRNLLHKKHPGHYIFRGSTVIALSFLGKVEREGQENGIRSSTMSSTPWRLLVLSTRNSSSLERYSQSDGFGAFLCAINTELHHARRCLRALSHTISSIAVPSVRVTSLLI